jgi:hypothetical protein
MKTTVELPDDLVKEIKLHALEEGQRLKEVVARLLRAGLDAGASREIAADARTLKRRRAITRRFVTGEWGVELTGYEEGRSADRRKAAERAKAWRK